MRILYLITELEEGGAEAALCEIARRTATAGHSVHVGCLYGGDGAVAVRLRSSGIPVTDLGISTAWPAGSAVRLRRLLETVNPDLVHSWLFHANLAARLLVPRRTPLINSLRVVEPRRSYVWLDRLTRRRAQRTLCVSEAVRAFAVETLRHDPARCRVIGNGIDIAPFEESRRGPRPDGVLRGLSVGRLVPQKGFDLLLEALSRLPAERAWGWTFVGGEPEPDVAARLKQRAVSLGIADRITWAGQVARSALPQIYGEANLFALPSRWEGEANVVLEAMAAGLPVLASRHSGFSVEAPIAVVREDTPAAWAAALTSHQPEEGLQSRMREYVQARSWDRVAEETLAVYRELTSSG